MLLLYIITVQMEIVVVQMIMAHTGISCAIHLVSPLTKETISTGNEGCRHYGGAGTIKSVDTDGKVLEVVYEGQDESDDEDDDY